MKTLPISLSALAGSAALCSAAVTYIDANTGNTQQASAPGVYTTFAPVSDGTGGSGTDNLWRDRTGSTNPSLTTTTSSTRRFEASDAGTPNEDAPRLRTSVGGFDVGATVEVYAYFWGAPGANQPWGLSAGLTDTVGPLQHYVGTLNGGPPSGSILATQINSLAGFTNAADITPLNSDLISGNQRLFQISLGQKTIGADGILNVYLDDFANVDNTVRRSTFDGIGFTQVPEPSVALLAAAGLLGLVRRRR